MFKITYPKMLALFLSLALNQDAQAGLNIKTKLATASSALQKVSQTPVMQGIAKAASVAKNGVKTYPYLAATLAAATAGGYYVQKKYYQYDRTARKNPNRYNKVRADAAKEITFGKTMRRFASYMRGRRPSDRLRWLRANPSALPFIASGLLFSYSVIGTVAFPPSYFTLGKLFNFTSLNKHAEKSALFWMKANALFGSAVVATGLALSLKIWLDARDHAAKNAELPDDHKYSHGEDHDREEELPLLPSRHAFSHLHSDKPSDNSSDYDEL